MLKSFVSKLFSSKDPVIIEPYGGFANETHIFSYARVLEDEGIEHTENDGVIKNLWNTYKRLESDEIEGAEVIVEWGRKEKSFISDDEGYIDIIVEHEQHIENEISKWLPISLRLNYPGHKFVTSTDILKPGNDVDFAVITDMDDTVIDTGVSSLFKWRLLVNSFAVHSQKRKPLEGVQEFYQKLHKGKSSRTESGGVIYPNTNNPFFYVSNSPWNLHEYLTDFLEHNNFPKGPLILRDIGLNNKKGKGIENSQKYLNIVRIIDAYPSMKFVLIGDAAELDTDIYLSLAHKYSDQIKAIFIRTVDNEKNIRRIKNLIEQQENIAVKLIQDSNAGIEFAKKLDLI